MGILGYFMILHYFRNCEIKSTSLILFFVLMGHTYWDTNCTYIETSWACPTWLWPIFGLAGLNKDLFESISDFWEIITFTCSRFSLSYIHDLVLHNKAWVIHYNLCTPVRDIIRLSHQSVLVALFLKDKYEMILSMKNIIYICRLAYVSWLPWSRISGSELGLDMGFELDLTVSMVMVSPVEYPLGYLNGTLLVFSLGNYFGTW